MLQRAATVAFCLLMLGHGAATITQPAAAVLFEGARLITPDAPLPIENSAFVVADGRFIGVGRSGSVPVPAGAVRVNLSGKTVIPALVNAHIHIGYDRGPALAAANFTRAHILEQLDRYAYAGVAAVASLGTDLGDVALAIRAQQDAGALAGTLLISAGRGMARPNAGPANNEMKPSAIGISSEEEGRAAVRGQAARGVPLIKIWVDDRNGTVEKLTPALYRAIIDEAHKQKTRVIAHVYYLEDARELVAAGVDGFAHLPRDQEIDAALVAEIKRRGVFVLPNLAISQNGTQASAPEWLDDPLFQDLVPPDTVARIRAAYSRRTPAGVERATVSYSAMQRTLAKLNAAGARIGFGTDAGAVPDHVHAFTDHRELRLMVQAGMTPAQALAAATRESAAIVGVERSLGTIEAGKSADFVVLDANPLDDIVNTRRIARVYLRGTEVNRDRMRREWTASTGGRQ